MPETPPIQRDLNLAIIGNCQIAAMIDARAQIGWSCWLRFDGDPVFCALLRDDPPSEESGLFDIELLGWARSEQCYEPNTAVLTTTLFDSTGRRWSRGRRARGAQRSGWDLVRLRWAGNQRFADPRPHHH